ncbi:hypothetical protein BN1263240024 [Stenotrophomonas thermophila]|nr:hypothetical protein BN1263240024 [Stenotrophomonas maltophilia]
MPWKRNFLVLRPVSEPDVHFERARERRLVAGDIGHRMLNPQPGCLPPGQRCVVHRRARRIAGGPGRERVG